MLMNADVYHIYDACEDNYINPAILSPNKDYQVLILESLCGSPGSSDIWSVKILNKQTGTAATVFGTYNNAPIVVWKNINSIIITITSVEGIPLSLHKFQGISIKYQLDPSLSYEKLEALKVAELQWIQAYRGGYAQELSTRTIEKFDSFQNWVKNNVD